MSRFGQSYLSSRSEKDGCHCWKMEEWRLVAKINGYHKKEIKQKISILKGITEAAESEEEIGDHRMDENK